TDPGEFLKQLNTEFTEILKQTGTVVFATMLYCIINVRRLDACLARAGHPAPLHARRASREAWAVEAAKGSAGPALGLIPNAQFNTDHFKVVPGDFLFFFTDGIIEAEAEGGTDFGLKGLQNSLQANLDKPGESVLESIINDVYSFCHSTVLIDD